MLPDAVLLGGRLMVQAVDGLASESVPVSDIPSEPNIIIWDYTVDDGSLVVER